MFSISMHIDLLNNQLMYLIKIVHLEWDVDVHLHFIREKDYFSLWFLYIATEKQHIWLNLVISLTEKYPY